MSRQNLDTQLQRVAQSANLPDLRLDSDGHCQVRIDGAIDLMIEFDADSESLLLTARCGPIPAAGREAVLLALLDANYYGAGSGGATLATNSSAGDVYLQFRESTSQLDQARLEALLKAVILNAEFWAARLPKVAAGTTAASTAAGGIPPAFLRA
jgi:hypothetical protein